jgi:hypothetical protein
MNRCITAAGEEGGHYGAIHGDIPHGGACPPGGGAHGIGDGQYHWLGSWGGVSELRPRGGRY